MTITIHWWTIPTILTVLSAAYAIWPSRSGNAWDSLARGFVALILTCVDFAAWLIGAFLK